MSRWVNVADLLSDVAVPDVSVNSVVADSRQVSEGSLFIALQVRSLMRASLLVMPCSRVVLWSYQSQVRRLMIRV